MIKILMHGSNGRMGQEVCNLVRESTDAEIIGGIDIVDKPCTFPVFSDISECDMPADVIIDFSFVNAIPKLLNYAVRKRLPLVLCTTGLTRNTLDEVNKSSEKIPIFMSANMSLGVNLMSSLAKKAAAMLYPADFDIEIIERHHNKKLDAPSGTAIFLGNAINSAIKNCGEFVFDRSKDLKKREHNEIGIHAVRGGTIVGEHTIVFAGNDEVIEIKHSAASKDIFATGALKAAHFLIGKPPGLYNMEDLFDNYV